MGSGYRSGLSISSRFLAFSRVLQQNNTLKTDLNYRTHR